MSATMPSAQMMFVCPECGHEIAVKLNISLDYHRKVVKVHGKPDIDEVRAHTATHGGAA